MNIIKAITSLTSIQPPSLQVLSVASVRRFLHNYEGYRSEVAQVASGGITVISAGVWG